MESLQLPPLSTGQNTLPVSKALGAVLLVFALIGFFVHPARNFFALVPAYAIPPHFYIWNVITAGYFEISLLNAITNIASLLCYGRYLEAIWGSKEFMKFIAIVNAASGIATFFLMLILFVITQKYSLWFNFKLCGFSAVISGFTIAMRQLIPEEPLLPFEGVKDLRAKHSMPILLVYGVFCVVAGLLPFETLPFTVFGIIFSWVYLRFFQVKDNVRGDLSESFSFASFFPEPLQPSMRFASKVAFNILKMLKICKSRSEEAAARVNTESFDTERRKARALAVLDQRMQQMKQFGGNTTDISRSNSEALSEV